MAAVPVVTFSYAEWVAAYPQFAAITEPQAQVYFNLAGLYCENSGCNPAYDVGILPMLLNLLTAHIAWLMAPRDASGNPSSGGSSSGGGIVGRITSASEGSVSVSSAWEGSGSPSETWYTQTQWGAMFWQATAQFRNMRYAANPVMVPGTSGYPFPYVQGAGNWPWRR